MSFISVEFLVFLLVVLPVYFVLNRTWQNRFLLLASYVFYGWWDWRFLSLIFISTVLDYSCGLVVGGESKLYCGLRAKKIALFCSVAGNLTILGFFKYFDFFIRSLTRLTTSLNLAPDLPLLEIVLPVGISFYTFQTMSYTIDVYQKKLSPCRSFLDLALYVSFFPQLVAGPIERGAHLLPQIITTRRVGLSGFYSGAQLAFVGLFKKMVLADNMALIVDTVFSQAQPASFDILIAIYAFAIQIYCDFSGYTDIARGIARVLGFDICVNFNLPYFATNPSDFWRRWHISLSTWLRDYLYIPLGGNRFGSFVTFRNLMLTMLLGGLWHGASWHFVLWGAYHALLLIVFHIFERKMTNSTYPGSRGRGSIFWLKVIGYFQLTCIGWLIFRVQTVGQFFYLSELLLNPFQFSQSSLLYSAQLAIAVLILVPFQVYQFYSGDREPWTKWKTLPRFAFYLLMLYGIILFGTPYEIPFIYFQF